MTPCRHRWRGEVGRLEMPKSPVLEVLEDVEGLDLGSVFGLEHCVFGWGGRLLE